MEFLHKEIVLSDKMEQSADTCYDSAKSQKRVEWKSNAKEQLLYDSIYVKFYSRQNSSAVLEIKTALGFRGGERLERVFN